MRSLAKHFSMIRCGKGGRNHSEFLTRPASPLLSFRDQDEVLRRLYIQLGTLLVADHNGFFATALAHPLVRRAWQNCAPRAEDSQAIPGGPDVCLISSSRWAGACSPSACATTSLTTGSGSNNCICACESFSPPAPYFSIRISRNRSSSTRIRSSAYCNLFFQLCDEFQVGWR
jgi:hypothetical protein